MFLAGNDISRSLVKAALDSGVPIGKLFAGTVLRHVTLKDGEREAKWATQQLSKRRALRYIAEAIGENLSRYNTVFTIGKIAGVLAAPTAGGFIANQVLNNDACIQLIVDQDGSKMKVDWSMVYAHSPEKRLTSAMVYKARGALVRKAVPVSLRMRCAGNGTVSVFTGGTRSLSHETSTFMRVG